ncbi:hypothetical protein [Micromonospora sp. NPDC023956]|uniref:hypothetical protein n=1 Tax=Micromonospora sp. NPDC023956 TaxID=3155722 RepID=UPI0033BFCEF2
MSGQDGEVLSQVAPGTPPAGAPAAHPPAICRRVPPTAYRCACGRLRERCVRLAVRALWAPGRLAPARPAGA